MKKWIHLHFLSCDSDTCMTTIQVVQHQFKFFQKVSVDLHYFWFTPAIYNPTCININVLAMR